jgi:hypothetical protein
MLFTSDLTDGRLELHEVVHSRRHVLRTFHLISLCDHPLNIHLRSDLGADQLIFQLENANLNDRRSSENYNEVCVNE